MRGILFLVILGVLLTFLWVFFQEVANVAEIDSEEPMDALVIERLSARLNKQVTFISTIRTEAGDWRFLCGAATEADGSDLVVAGTPLEQGILDGSANNTFCALANVQTPDHLTEFDFGFTDMPAFDWLERHDLPMDILSEPSE